MADEQRQEGGGSRKRHDGGPDAVEHGKRATFDPKSGEVHGSGSGAGGGSPNEDFDDSAGGGGEVRASQHPGVDD